MTPPIPRRSALGLLASAAAGAALPLALPHPAAAQFAGGTAVPAGLRFSRIAVDTAALAVENGPATADIVAAELTASLRQVFGDLLAARDARGATLLARISSFRLSFFVGPGSGGAKGNGPDHLEGVGIVAAGGRVLSETPLLATLDASYSGAWYQPGIDRVRVQSISYQFAYWLRREMGV